MRRARVGYVQFTSLNTRAGTLSLSLSLSHTHTVTLAHAHACSHSRRHARPSSTHASACARFPCPPSTHTHSRTHARAGAYTHARTVPLSLTAFVCSMCSFYFQNYFLRIAGKIKRRVWTKLVVLTVQGKMNNGFLFCFLFVFVFFLLVVCCCCFCFVFCFLRGEGERGLSYVSLFAEVKSIVTYIFCEEDLVV